MSEDFTKDETDLAHPDVDGLPETQPFVYKV